MRRRQVIVASCVLGALLCVPLGAAADDYSDPDYLQHDLDNYFRARGRTIGESTDPAYHPAFAGACADSTGRSAAKQANDVRFGRVYASVGHATCWWSVGHAPGYFDITPRRVFFLARTGAKLQGHIWGADAPGPRPGIVITTGSIQASDQMYWWAARALVQAGYVVLTYDVQQQGGSEAFSHEPGSPVPGLDGFPAQTSGVYLTGTIDAMRFFLSTPSAEYVPQGWTQADVDAAKAASEGEQLDWVSPAWGPLDRGNIGIAGHSAGAGAVSSAQQCSDSSTLWQTLDFCGGRSFPIRAVVAFDALSSSPTPVVPAMDQKADGYFLFPTLTPTAPDPAESLPAFEAWRDAELDVFMYVVRGGTHIEWSQVPYTAATTYGVHANAYYMVAWFDRWVKTDPGVRADAYGRLVGGPTSDPASSLWAANYFSARRFSAMSIRAPGNEGGSADVEATDLRAWAGRSPVGDWAGANADTAGRVLP